MAETPEKTPASPVHNDAADKVLVKRFNQGDDSAFDRIVEANCADIAALANRLLGWPGDVEDVVQDIFLAAFLGLKKFRCQCSLKSWLFAITINECRDYRYRRMLRFRLFSRAAVKASSSSADAADKTVMSRETFNRIRRAVKALPAKYREPLVLRYLQQLPTDEISRILGISDNTLQVRLSRARKRLKQELAELMEE
ncbi:MAG TPA: RNA polymerase sigma factor [Sedimentisphaerales bacterium]|nr:RNA polymerase sigma factor [Sedimentisphaerales bacterium]